MMKNPTFYGLKGVDAKTVNSYLVELVDESIKKLEEHGCVTCSVGLNVEPTFLGYIASFYYLKHESVHFFK